MRVREGHGHLGAARPDDPVVRVILLHEMPRPPHRHCVEHVKKNVGPQVVRIFLRSFLEPFFQRPDAAIRKRRIVPNEQGQQIVQVPQRVVDRRGCQQHQLFGRLAQQQPPQGCRAACLRVAERLRLVHDDHRVLVQATFQVGLTPAQLGIVKQLLVGNDFQVQLLSAGE